MPPEKIFEDFLTYCIDDRDEDAFRALFSDDFKQADDLAASVVNADDVLLFCAMVAAQVEDLSTEIKFITASAPWVSGCAVFHGTVRATRKPLIFGGTTHLKIEGGKIVAMWNSYDMLRYCIEIGKLHPGFMAEALYYGPTAETSSASEGTAQA